MTLTYYWIKHLPTSDWEPGLPTNRDGSFQTPSGEYVPREVGPRIFPPRAEQAPTVLVEQPDPWNRMASDLLPPLQYDTFTEVHHKRGSDCCVVALANILQIDWNKSRMICFHHGWSTTKGMDLGQVQHYLEKEGYRIRLREWFADRSVNEMTDIPEDRVYLCVTKDHAMAIMNGRVLNIAGTEKDKIVEVVEVHPPENS